VGLLKDLGLDESSVAWWSVAALKIPRHTDPSRVRNMAERGHLRHIARQPKLVEIWRDLVREAQALAKESSITEQIAHSETDARHWALRSPRAFVEMCHILDDTLKVPLLKDFHIRALRLMREQPHALILMPFSHGKTWLSSVLVPLMDWAENPEFTECRIFCNKDVANLWMFKMMGLLTNTPALPALFPWVQRPYPENPVSKFWSTKGFAIEGKKALEPNYEGLGVGQGTGRRFWRVGCDDWVVSDNATSQLVQDKYWSYFHTAPMTMSKPLPWFSKYDTKASTVFVVGTLFDKRDFNHRLMQAWREQGRQVARIDIYTDKSKAEVIWPEERPLEWVAGMQKSLGEQHFNMRCRNIVIDDASVSFKPADVERAFKPELRFGDSLGMPCIVGFDPATGKTRTRATKFPAAVVVGFQGDDMHIIRWGRHSVPMPSQCDLLADLAHAYNCPVAVEDASQQISYQDWMRQRYPDVKVMCHTTNVNKRDWSQGVESLIPYFEQDRVKIHSSGATEQDIGNLRDELVDYPQGRYSDLVMALWVAKHQYSLYQSRFRGKFETHGLPSYVTRHPGEVVVDLRAIRERRRAI
jgi:hypothetical protein